MKKKIIAGAIASTFALLGVGFTAPIYAESNDSTIKLMANTTTASGMVKDIALDTDLTTTFEVNGINYTLESNKLVAKPISNPESVNKIVLHDYLHPTRNFICDYSKMDFSGYTNVNTVVVLGNATSNRTKYLASLQSQYRLFLGGQVSFEGLEELNCTDIVFCAPYEGLSNLNGTYQANILAQSNINKIFYPSYATWLKSTATSFNSRSLRNIKGETANMQLASNSMFTFDPSIFFPDNVSLQTNRLGCVTHPYIMYPFDDPNLFLKYLTFDIDSMDSKIQSLVINNNTVGTNFSSIKIPSLTLTRVIDTQSFNGLTCAELNIKNTSSIPMYINQMPNVNTLRLYSTVLTGGPTISTVYASGDSTPDKILIPLESAETKYSTIYNNADLEGKIETYEYASYTAPEYSSFKSDDGNIYLVKDESLSLDQLEEGIVMLKELGYEIDSTIPLDIQMEEAEIPYRAQKATYSLRDIKKLYITKNIDPIKAIEVLKDKLLLKDSLMCDEEYQITFDKTNYKEGDNSTIKIVATMPDDNYYLLDLEICYIEGEMPSAIFTSASQNLYLLTKTTNKRTLYQQLELAAVYEYGDDIDIKECCNFNQTIPSYTQGTQYTCGDASGDVRILNIEDLNIHVDGYVEEDPNLVDQSALIEGNNCAGYIYYASERPVEEILKIAANYLLWQDGNLMDMTGYSVKYEIEDNILRTNIYDSNGQIYLSVSAYLKEYTLGDLGEFIYVENIHHHYGSLLVDINQTRDDDINYIYEQILSGGFNLNLNEENIIKGFTYKEECGAIATSTATHNTFENVFKTKVYVISTDFDKNINNIETEISYLLINKSEEYQIKELEAIYVPKDIDAIPLLNIIRRDLVLHNGMLDKTNEILFTFAHNELTGEDYDLTVSCKLPDNTYYLDTIRVYILKSTPNLGIVKLKDGTLYTIYPLNTYTEETLESDITTSIQEMGISIPNVKLSSNVSYEYTSFTEDSSYSNGTLKLQSVEALDSFSSWDNPIDESRELLDCNILGEIYFTDKFTIEQAVKAIGNYIIVDNGKWITDPSEYKIETIIDKETVTFKVYKNNEEVLLTKMNYYKIDSKVGDYIYAKSNEFHMSTLLIEPTNTVDINDLYKETILLGEKYYNNPTIETEGNMNEIGTNILIQPVCMENGDWYTSYMNIVKSNINYEDSIVTILETTSDTAVPEVETSWTDNISNNPVLKASLGILGAVSGVLLIYGIYKIFRKLYKWLKG